MLAWPHRHQGRSWHETVHRSGGGACAGRFGYVRRFRRGAADKPYEGITLNLASQNDQFAAVLAAIAPEFEALTGAKVNVDILSYPELLTKITADYVGHTKGYDLATVDIVWSGQFAEAGYTVDLTDWIKRDAAEIKVDDIYPSLMASLGGYKGKQVAFPFAGYANVLAYRKDLYEAAGLKPPATMEEFVADAMKLTDKSKKAYGFVANGQKGPAVAQDWMQYNRQFGGSILDKDGKPTLNSPANIASVVAYKKLFDEAAPPGAADYDWGGREESFRQGAVANMQTWSIGAADYDNPKVSKIAGKAGIMLTPSAQGQPQEYGIGGWALGINKDIDAQETGSRVGVHQMGHEPGSAQGPQPARRRQLSAQERNDRSGAARQIPVPAGDRDLVRARRRRLPPSHSTISGIAGSDRRRHQCGAGRAGRSQDRNGRHSGQGRGFVQVIPGQRA